MAVAIRQIQEKAGGAPPPTIAFRKASLAKRTLDDSVSPNAALGSKHSWELKSKGMLARLRALVAGNVATTTADPVAQADFPWAMARRIEVRDSSAGMLHSCSGYSNYLATRYFQPLVGRDLAKAGDSRIYQPNIAPVSATNALRFAWDVPIEAGTRDNIGLVPNQNAAFKYTLDIELRPEADLVTTTANTAWDGVTIQPSYRYQTVPAPQRVDGAIQQVQPPFAGVLRQVYDEVGKDVPSTGAELRFDVKPGKVVRNLIVVTRTDTQSPGTYTARAGGLSRFKVKYGDDVTLFDATDQDLIEEAYQLYGEVPPLGVYPITWCADADGLVGADFRRDLLDTRELTQIWMEITFATGTGNFDLIHDELIVPRTMSL